MSRVFEVPGSFFYGGLIIAGSSNNLCIGKLYGPPRAACLFFRAMLQRNAQHSTLVIFGAAIALYTITFKRF
jgi:hypothetical protein